MADDAFLRADSTVQPSAQFGMDDFRAALIGIALGVSVAFAWIIFAGHA